MDVSGDSCAGGGVDGLALPAYSELADGADASAGDPGELCGSGLDRERKKSLLGAGLGLGILLPFVLIRSLGAGDWKLIGALGAFLGPSRLITVLMWTILVAGLMAVVMIIWTKRVKQTARNLAHMIAGLFTLHLPGPEVSLDNPESSKIPFGVAVAVTVVLYTVSQAWSVLGRQ